ncbi:GNAT family N-acetyltransferase, partial [Oxalobacteraceae bacterium OM1]
RLPLSWWEARMQPGDDASEMVFGAFDGERLVGVAGLSFEAREKLRHKAHLFGMFVHAEARQAGAGRQLVRAVQDAARARPGVRVLQLTVTEGNVPAVTLYERCGFVAFGVEPMAVCSGGLFFGKVHMWCDLGKKA